MFFGFQGVYRPLFKALNMFFARFYATKALLQIIQVTCQTWFTRVVASLYANNLVCVSWGGVVSEYIWAENDVKQGASSCVSIDDRGEAAGVRSTSKQAVSFGKQSILLSKSTKYKCRKVNGTQGNTMNQHFRPLLQTSSVKWAPVQHRASLYNWFLDLACDWCNVEVAGQWRGWI